MGVNLNRIMNITNATKEALVTFIIGGDGLWKSRTGKELVSLFQTYGFRNDIYDFQKGGLPKLGNSTLNTSKKIMF